jgi:AcrR family transcriptional regulator
MPSSSDTRAKLLVAARQAFADLGYEKARVEDVVTRAGVGHGTFYAYFPNKRAALAALVHDFAEAQLKLASEPWRPGDVRASLTEALTGIVELYDRDADLIKLWTTTAANDPELSELVDDVRRQLVARIARNIERSQAQGMARPVDPHIAATILSAMFQQTMVLLVVRHEPLDRDLTVATLIDLWYHALYTPAADI